MKSKGNLDSYFIFMDHLFVGEPTVIRECELHFIPVEIGIVATNYRKNRGVFEASDAAEGIDDALPFELELLLIIEILPGAPAAHSKVFTFRCDSIFRWR